MDKSRHSENYLWPTDNLKSICLRIFGDSTQHFLGKCTGSFHISNFIHQGQRLQGVLVRERLGIQISRFGASKRSMDGGAAVRFQMCKYCDDTARPLDLPYNWAYFQRYWFHPILYRACRDGHWVHQSWHKQTTGSSAWSRIISAGNLRRGPRASRRLSGSIVKTFTRRRTLLVGLAQHNEFDHCFHIHAWAEIPFTGGKAVAEQIPRPASREGLDGTAIQPENQSLPKSLQYPHQTVSPIND